MSLQDLAAFNELGAMGETREERAVRLAQMQRERMIRKEQIRAEHIARSEAMRQAKLVAKQERAAQQQVRQAVRKFR